MKKTPTTKSRKVQDMATEYRFDYKKAKPNRFAARMKDEPLVVMIEPDIAKVFKSSEPLFPFNWHSQTGYTARPMYLVHVGINSYAVRALP
jgi:hypothetical protein